MAEGGTINVEIELSPSEEREAIAKFLEAHAFLETWQEKKIIEAIRSGDYLMILIRDAAENTGREK